ncbi:septal ring lytic transglycosylase RlpA family protein [Brevundimonas sp. 2R-24]|uniref:Endolytic peptidoglycan transglycosylase RlpA n=1 Tax=Peiella sedimenti TaxID=3061083 RepID=A0ABT8SJA3_9CAUL|nr:septal ring lytic transglycosylase RlpA family protein [Caulobacteraceae bacterium XZ-24]
MGNGRLSILRAALVGLLALTAAACASTPRGSLGPSPSYPSRPAATPQVSDPAPIVSGTMRPYQVRGRWYTPQADPDYDEVGQASWYGDAFHGRPTATGERFDMHGLSAAHKTLPLPGLVEVTNLENGRSVVLRLNDRGPFVDGRIIDLSRGAADQLGLLQRGVGQVRVRYLGPAPRGGGTGQPSINPETARPVWVQAGAFAERDNAEGVARQLGQARIDETRVDGRRLYRVLLGPWTDPNEAELARARAVSLGLWDARLVAGL